jgi:uncharacterized protein (TIRG00374 family)
VVLIPRRAREEFKFMSKGSSSTNHTAAVWVSLLVSLAILGFLAYRLDWGAFYQELGRIKVLYVPVLVVLVFGAFWIRALRWRHLLPSDAGVSRLRLLEATLVGFTATFVLPLRAGELIRPWVLSRWEPVSFSVGFASIVAERVFDALTLMLLLGLTLGQLEEVPPLVTAGANMMAVLAVSILALMIYSYLYSARVVRFGERIIAKVLGKRSPALSAKLIHMIDEFLVGLRGISSFKELAWVVFWSLALWFEFVLMYQCGLWSFGLDPSIWVGLTLCVMIALAVAAPGAPGFLGTFQLGCVVALTIYGFSEEFAVAYSVVLHSIQVISVVLAGFLILHRRGLHLGDIKKEAREDC